MCLDLFQVAPVPFNFRKRPLNCRNLVVAYGSFGCILEGLMWSDILLVIKQSYLKQDEGGYGAKEAIGLTE